MDARCGITTLVFEKKLIIGIHYALISHKYASCQILTFKKNNNKRINACN